jgi:hypothetical protein
MEDQNRQPLAHDQSLDPQPVSQPIPNGATSNQIDKAKLEIPDATAQALLMINGVQATKQPKSGPSLGLIISVVMLIAAVVIVSFLVGNIKPGKNSKSPGSSDQSTQRSTDSTTNQINQDVNSCSNPAIAISQC